MKIFFLAIAVLVAAFVVWISLFIYFGTREQHRYEVWYLFDSIFNTALQLDRVGVIGVPQFNTPEIEYPPDLRERPESISCASGVRAKVVDPTKFPTSSVLVISDSPLFVLAIYSGKPPDIDAFLKNKNLQRYLGPQRAYVRNPIQGGPVSLGLLRGHQDVWPIYMRYIGGRTLSITSVQCPTFSYSILKGK